MTVPFGNHGAWAVRGGVSGPVDRRKAPGGRLLGGAGEPRRVHLNDITGNDIDSRSGFSAKGQMLFKPDVNWEARVIVSGERARDGDYGLNDVAALRANPFQAARDFEGLANRDIFGTTIHVRRTGGPLVFSSTTGIVKWKTQDVTDLDYTPLPLIHARQHRGGPAVHPGAARRVGGAVADPAVRQRQAALAGRRVLLHAGLRAGRGQQLLAVPGRAVPGLAALAAVGARRLRRRPVRPGDGDARRAVRSLGRRALRPRVEGSDARDVLRAEIAPARARRCREGLLERLAAGGGRLAPQPRAQPLRDRRPRLQGGRLQLRLAARSKRTTRSRPGTSRAASRRCGRAAAFGQRRGLPHRLGGPAAERAEPGVPAQFFISNVGGATSKGVELELGARAAPGLDLFAPSATPTRGSARAASPAPISIEGNKMPEHAGLHTERRRAVHALVGRADAGRSRRGRALRRVPVRRRQLARPGGVLAGTTCAAGTRRGCWLAEVFVRNAFNTEYIPLAFPYPNFAPSGFMGEMARRAPPASASAFVSSGSGGPAARRTPAAARKRPTLCSRLGVRFASDKGIRAMSKLRFPPFPTRGFATSATAS